MSEFPFGKEFNQSLTRLAEAQSLYRDQALIGQAPPYFIVSTELQGQNETSTGVALATTDMHLEEGQVPPYGRLFTFVNDPKLKLSSELMPLHDRQTLVSALLRKIRLSKAKIEEGWLQLADKTVETIESGSYELETRWLALQSLQEGLLPAMQRRQQEVLGRANVPERHIASFTGGIMVNGRPQCVLKTVNAVSGRQERHIMHSRYGYLAETGQPIEYAIDRPLSLTLKQDDILVVPEPEARAKAEALPETIDNLIEGVVNGQHIFVQFRVHADERQITGVNTKVKNGSKVEWYRLPSSEFLKLHLKKSGDFRRSHGCFVEIVDTRSDRDGNSKYTCKIVGPDPKDMSLKLPGGYDTTSYICRQLSAKPGIEILHPQTSRPPGSVYRLASKLENEQGASE